MRRSVIGGFVGMLGAVAMLVACGSGGGGDGAAGTAVTAGELAAIQASIDEIELQLPLLRAPTGTMAPFAGGAHVPEGWLVCDGAEVSRVDHADLFVAIGSAWGEGDGSTTFNLPDLRGRFVRGVDGGAGRDPDVSLRVETHLGGNTGDTVGSLQQWATARPQSSDFTTDVAGQHDHGYRGQAGGSYHGTSPGIPASPSGTLRTTADGDHSHSVTEGGDAETRPVNVSVFWLIKS